MFHVYMYRRQSDAGDVLCVCTETERRRTRVVCIYRRQRDAGDVLYVCMYRRQSDARHVLCVCTGDRVTHDTCCVYVQETE